MEIRSANKKDIDEIMVVFETARCFMAKTGNRNQWVDGYPSRMLIENDIANGNCFVLFSRAGVEGVFVFILGEDPTYQKIYEGAWRNTDAYGTIHRLASAGRKKGVAAECIGRCFRQCGNLRADTHEDNKVMQHILEKSGFESCGRIYLNNHAPRIAYQKID